MIIAGMAGLLFIFFVVIIVQRCLHVRRSNAHSCEDGKHETPSRGRYSRKSSGRFAKPSALNNLDRGSVTSPPPPPPPPLPQDFREARRESKSSKKWPPGSRNDCLATTALSAPAVRRPSASESGNVVSFSEVNDYKTRCGARLQM